MHRLLKLAKGLGLDRRFELFWSVLKETLDEFSKDRGDLLAAALAFYMLLSVAPLVIVAVAIAGSVLGTAEARLETTRLLSDAMGPTAANAVNGWVDQASRRSGVATFVGGLLILFTASRLVGQLRSALNQIWNVDVRLAEGFKATVRDYLSRRMFAFALVLASGPLLLSIFASRALLTGLHRVLFANSPLAGLVVQTAQVLFSVGLVAAITAIVFKVVPDKRLGWPSVWKGAVLTSVLFNVGNYLVGLYLGRAGVSAAYGAAGSVVVVLLWMYFSAQLFVLGAEFTQVYSRRFGAGLKPDEERENREAESRGQASAEASAAGEAERLTS